MHMSLFLTDSAKKHFSRLTQDNKSIQLSLKKSGCSGFSYSLNIVNKEENIDGFQLFNFQSIPFLISSKDIQALNNLVIDYKNEGLNQKLIFDNPNTMNECGCGESFGLKI